MSMSNPLKQYFQPRPLQTEEDRNKKPPFDFLKAFGRGNSRLSNLEAMIEKRNSVLQAMRAESSRNPHAEPFVRLVTILSYVELKKFFDIMPKSPGQAVAVWDNPEEFGRALGKLNTHDARLEEFLRMPINPRAQPELLPRNTLLLIFMCRNFESSEERKQTLEKYIEETDAGSRLSLYPFLHAQLTLALRDLERFKFVNSDTIAEATHYLERLKLFEYRGGTNTFDLIEAHIRGMDLEEEITKQPRIAAYNPPKVPELKTAFTDDMWGMNLLSKEDMHAALEKFVRSHRQRLVNSLMKY